MQGTQKPISQVVATSRESAAKFALQMAQQSRKFGARVAELRDDRHWKQRDLVAEMEKLGDRFLNTNQLSRYENGGAMPGEQRQEWFAEALGTTVADLHAGSMADRKSKGTTPDPFAKSTGDTDARLRGIEDRLSAIEALLRDLPAVLQTQRAVGAAKKRRKSQSRPQSRKDPPAKRTGKATAQQRSAGR